MYDLGISAEQIPLDRVVALARHTKKDLPEDLTATGTGDFIFTVRRDRGAVPVWAGGGRTTQFALRSKVLAENLELGEVQLSIPSRGEEATDKRIRRAAKTAHVESTNSLRVVVKPFAMPLGAASPTTADGYFDLAHYRITLTGDAEMTRLMSIAKAMGIGVPAIGLAGPGHLDLEIAGAWTGFAPPAPSGKLQLHDATAELQGVGEPLQLASVTVTLADQTVAINSFSAEFKDGTSISGSASFPLRCIYSEPCVLRFDLHTPEITQARLNQLLNPSYQSRPWYHLLAIGQRDENALMKLQARGRLAAGRLAIGDLLASDFVSRVEMTSGKLSLKDIRADALGGHHTGNWDADFTSTPPKYFGSGTVTKIAMAQVAALTHDPWATGTIDGEYTLGVAGATASAIRDSASGTANFKWTAGSLRHVALDPKGTPLTFSSFDGQAVLRNGTISCQGCKLQTAGGLYDVTGDANFNRTLAARIENSGKGVVYVISGPLEKPIVEPAVAPAAEAKVR
jgi:AsmA-like C-terminal region